MFFATLFDQNYLATGLALRYSLRKHHAEFRLYVLCLDDCTYQFFSKEAAEDTVPVPLSALETFYPVLQVARGNRSWPEYLFTLSPFWPRYLLENFQDLPHIATLDADIFFFASAAPLFLQLEQHDILITLHRFSEPNLHKLKYGRYNVSFQIFKRTATALQCLERWGQQCAEWCYDRLEENRFADQKYLDDWPLLYGNSVKEITHKGAGIAPWNMQDLQLHFRKAKLHNGTDHVIFVHFHMIRFIKSRLVTLGHDDYYLPFHRQLVWLYAPYISVMRKFFRELQLKQQFIRYSKKYNAVQLRHLLIYGGAFYYAGAHLLIPVRLEKIYSPLRRILKSQKQ